MFKFVLGRSQITLMLCNLAILSLAVSCLLINAYGLSNSGMELYHGQEKAKNCFKLVGGIKIRFTVDDFRSSWRTLEKGIVKGYTVSPLLIIMGKRMVVQERDKRNATQMGSGVYQTVIRNFLNNFSVQSFMYLYSAIMLLSVNQWKSVFLLVLINFNPRMVQMSNFRLLCFPFSLTMSIQMKTTMNVAWHYT